MLERHKSDKFNHVTSLLLQSLVRLNSEEGLVKKTTAFTMGHTDWEDSFFPSTIGCYKLDGLIGSGTFGEVEKVGLPCYYTRCWA